jgi:hypothetical protein
LDESLFWARHGFARAPNVAIAYYHVGAPLILLAGNGAADRWLHGAEVRFPSVPRIQILLSIREFLSGNERAAESRLRRALVAHPDDPELQIAAAELTFLTGAPDAPARIASLFKQAPEAHTFLLPETFRTIHAYLLTQSGDTPRAKALLDDARSAAQTQLDGGSESSDVPMEIAAIHALRGEREEALRWTHAAYQAGWRLFREMSRDPFFSRLRNDSEFQRIRQRIDDDVRVMRRRADVNNNPHMPALSTIESARR